MQPRLAIADGGLRARLPGRRGEVTIGWEQLLAVRSGRGTARVLWLTDQGRREHATLPAASRTELDEIRGRWSRALEARAHRLGVHEGTTVGEPGRADTVLLGALCLGFPAWAAWLVLGRLADLSNMSQQVGALPREERTAVAAAAVLLALGGCLLAATLAGLMLRMLALRAAARRWSRWRLGPDGLARRQRDGSWRQVGYEVHGDRLLTAEGSVPLSLLSGGRLTRQLLLGLARRRGHPPPSGSHLGPAIRMVVWPAVLWGAAWAAARSLGLPIDQEAAVPGLALSGALAAVVAGLLLVADRLAHRERARAVAGGRELLERLGW